MWQRLSRAIAWLGQYEGVLLVGLLIPVAGAWAFIALADTVMEGHTQHLDDRLLRALRRSDDPATPIGPPWMAEAARDVTALGSVTVIALVTVVVASFLLLDRKVAATAFILAATGSGFTLA